VDLNVGLNVDPNVELSDSVLRHLRAVVDLPDLTGTRYQLEEEIGRGGLGVVYAARDTELDRRVAIKVMDAAWAGEARLIARLEHPGIVPVYEAGMLPDGRAFYAMKLVAGVRADRYLAANPSLGERLRVVERVGEALAYAHSCGVLHRDLKPQNVMVGRFGEVYVMDWGVEGVAGTPAFRAPETPLDQRSDVYALGALVRFVLPADAPPALGAIAAKAMRENPQDRYPDVAGMLRDIERFQDGLAVEAYSESPWQRVRRVARRNEVLLWLLAAYAVVKFLLFFVRGF
jgi:serine/threonine protein kinase